MPTKIIIKNSGASGNVPAAANLDHGELALNYADGYLFYKNSSNSVQRLSGGNTFVTINANGTIVSADSTDDAVSLLPGSGIDITSNAQTDSITISARLVDSTNSTSTTEAATANSVKNARDAVNTVLNISVFALNTANVAANIANNSANTAAVAANNANNSYNIALLAYAAANGAYANSPGPAYDQANAAQTTAQNAYGAANTSANTVRVSQNSGSTLSSKQLNFVNTANVTITVTDSGNGNANIAIFAAAGGGGGDSTAAYNQANLAYAAANTAQTTSQNAYGQANLAYGAANTAQTTAQNAYGAANAAQTTAQNAYGAANTAQTTAQNAYAQANSNYQPAVTRLDVTNNGASAYRFDQYGSAVDGPTLYVRAGETIAFNLNNAGHPFAIRVSSGGSTMTLD